MFRLPYEQHRAAAQGSIASGLAIVHHAAIVGVPEGRDNLNRRLADGWRGIKDVKGFQKALEQRIKAFIDRIDVSSDYEATIPGADLPWTGKIHSPRLNRDGTPRDPIHVVNAEVLQHVECNNAQVPVATIPAGRERQPIKVKHKEWVDEWVFQTGWANERKGFSFTLWAMHYSGPEGERFFHIMFDEGNSVTMPVINGAESAPARPQPRDDPPTYAPPVHPGQHDVGEPPAYASRNPHESTLRSLSHILRSRRTSSSDSSIGNSGSDSLDLRQRPATGREKRTQVARSTENTPAPHHADPEASDPRVTGVADRPDYTAVLPYYPDLKDDTLQKVGKWDEHHWTLLEARIRAFIAFYTARVGSYQHVFRGRIARTQHLHFSRRLVHLPRKDGRQMLAKVSDLAQLVEITVHLCGVWMDVRPEVRLAARTKPAFLSGIVMPAFALPGAVTAVNPRFAGDDERHSSHPRVEIPVGQYTGSKQHPTPPALKTSPNDVWNFSTRSGPAVPNSGCCIPARTTWTVEPRDRPVGPTVIVHFAHDDKFAPLERNKNAEWHTFNLGAAVIRKKARRDERVMRTFE